MAPIEPLIPGELAPDERTSRHMQPGRVQLLARGTSQSQSTSPSSSLRARFGLLGVARRTLGITLLLITVLLWTVSNFLASVSPLQL
jgi:solute carrier family 35, member F5